MWMLDYKILDILGCAIGTAVVRDNNLKVGKCLGAMDSRHFTINSSALYAGIRIEMDIAIISSIDSNNILHIVLP